MASRFMQLGIDVGWAAREYGNELNRTGRRPARRRGAATRRRPAAGVLPGDRQSAPASTSSTSSGRCGTTCTTAGTCAVDKAYAPTVRWKGTSNRLGYGRSDVKGMARALLATFPDLGMQVDEVYWMGNEAEGFRVSVRWSAAGHPPRLRAVRRADRAPGAPVGHQPALHHGWADHRGLDDVQRVRRDGPVPVSDEPAVMMADRPVRGADRVLRARPGAGRPRGQRRAGRRRDRRRGGGRRRRHRAAGAGHVRLLLHLDRRPDRSRCRPMTRCSLGGSRLAAGRVWSPASPSSGPTAGSTTARSSSTAPAGAPSTARRTSGTPRSCSSRPADQPPPVVDTAAGRIGLMVCYDLEFPEMTRSVALRGADLLLCRPTGPGSSAPTGWPAAEVVIAMAAARVNRMADRLLRPARTERGHAGTRAPRSSLPTAGRWPRPTPPGSPGRPGSGGRPRDKAISDRNDCTTIADRSCTDG